MAAVPHRITETIQLKNLGISVPSPIHYHYNWPGQFDPMYHQRVTAEFATINNKCLIANGIGTGKTLASLWAADFLMREGMINRCIVVCPMSTMESVWGDTLYLNFRHRSYGIVYGGHKLRSGQRRREMVFGQGHDFYIVNHDGFKLMLPLILQRTDINAIIFDEAAVLRNGTAGKGSVEIFRTTRKLVRDRKLDWIQLITATPVPNEPADAWALANIIGSRHCPSAKTRFREATMTQLPTGAWVAKQDAMSYVSAVLQPSIRFRKEACLDLPPITYTSHKMEMTKEQKTAYDLMYNTFRLEYGKGVIDAANALVKTLKLLQITSGICIDTPEKHIEYFVPKGKLKALKEIIQQCDEKVIVFSGFTGSLELIRLAIAKYTSVDMVFGGVSQQKRRKIFHRFQHTEEPRVLLAHPKTMAHGLTLTAATTVIWWGPIYHNEIYEQACERIFRIGQTLPTTVINFTSSPVEAECYRRLLGRKNMQGLLLSLLENNSGGSNVIH